MLISTVLVMLMTMPGIILFYSGMLRSKNALSIVAHTVAGAAVITLLWSMFGYSIAFTSGGPWFGDTTRFFAEGLVGNKVGAHAIAPTIPESVFFLFQLSFAMTPAPTPAPSAKSAPAAPAPAPTPAADKATEDELRARVLKKYTSGLR